MTDTAAIIDAAIARALRHEFIWGSDDCCLWVSGIVKDITGLDLMAPFTGYSDRASAYRVIADYAGGDLEAALAKRMSECGFVEAEAPFDGDLIGILPQRDGATVALLVNGHWLCRSEKGIARIPAKWASRAWRFA